MHLLACLTSLVDVTDINTMSIEVARIHVLCVRYHHILMLYFCMRKYML